MAAAQDRKMFSNSSGPSASQTTRVPVLVQGRSSDSPPDTEPQGGPSRLRVEVTVRRQNRGHQVFRLRGGRRDGARTLVHCKVLLYSPLLRLRSVQHSTTVCTSYTTSLCETLTSRVTDTPFVLTNNNDNRSGQSVQLVTLYLTITVSPNTISYPILPINAPDLQSTKINDSPSGEAEKPSLPPDSTNPTCSTVASGSGTLSPVENVLLSAGGALATINLSNTWEGALERIKWVMDTVSPVAELHPYAKMAYSLFFAIPKTLLEQFQLDDNIRTLLAAMHDSFDFANQEDRFKAIGRDSKQASILTLMLQHVCNCCDFIRSYAKDSQFCT
ncbi:hypothetical protein EDB87DRAFT_1822157 [Lactarius vividus]|nr:hypothetical protein EDB87DRAFT_1822157 [Lactarius vividus]